MIFFLAITVQEFEETARFDWKNVKKILIQCFPLFVGLFLQFYIGNAPKYAIDAILSDNYQAIYGFIAMPVFIISLLNSMIFNPIPELFTEQYLN